MSNRIEPRPSIRLLISGLLGLATIAWESKGRLNGRYWKWRTTTAFGPGSSRRGHLWHALAFGDWSRRMRRLGQ